jgi:hypothetical protein
MSSSQCFAIVESRFTANNSRQIDLFDRCVEGGLIGAVLVRSQVEWRDQFVYWFEVGK